MGIYRSLVKQAISKYLAKWLKTLQKGHMKVALSVTIDGEFVEITIRSIDLETFYAQLALIGIPVQKYRFTYKDFEIERPSLKRRRPIRM